VADPINSVEVGKYMLGRIINVGEDRKMQISLRESVVNEHNWKSALDKASGTTLQFKKLFSN